MNKNGLKMKLINNNNKKEGRKKKSQFFFFYCCWMVFHFFALRQKDAPGRLQHHLLALLK